VPWYSTGFSRAQISLQMSMYSFTRFIGLPYGWPCHPSTTCGPDAPIPMMNRPFES